jgi:hypothetical protein
VNVWAEVSERHFHAYEAEARRRGDLVQLTVNSLLRELERDEEEDRDRELITS